MTDTIHILNGDTLDEGLLAEALGRTGISDYVERGLVPSKSDVDFQNAVVDVPAGKAFVLDNGRDVMLMPDARAGVQLATDGINHLFIAYDLSQPEGERINYHVDSDGTPPTQPSLEIAAIDMGAKEVRPQNDTAPIYRRDAETYKGNDIDPEGDGVVTEAESANHVAGSDVDGAVASADSAGALDGGSGTATIESDVDAGQHELTNLGRTALRFSAGKGITFDFETGGATPASGDVTRLVPYAGSEQYSEALWYDYADGRWQFGGEAVARRFRVGGINGNGLDMQFATPSQSPTNANLSQIVPSFNGDRQYANELRYEYPEERWRLKGKAVIERLRIGDVNGNGLDMQFLTPSGSPTDANLSRLVPSFQGDRKYGKALWYRYDDDKWTFKAPVAINGSDVLDRSDESGLDVNSADTADKASNANKVNGYEIQKNGSDGNGIINFKTG